MRGAWRKPNEGGDPFGLLSYALRNPSTGYAAGDVADDAQFAPTPSGPQVVLEKISVQFVSTPDTWAPLTHGVTVYAGERLVTLGAWWDDSGTNPTAVPTDSAGTFSAVVNVARTDGLYPTHVQIAEQATPSAGLHTITPPNLDTFGDGWLLTLRLSGVGDVVDSGHFRDAHAVVVPPTPDPDTIESLTVTTAGSAAQVGDLAVAMLQYDPYYQPQPYLVKPAAPWVVLGYWDNVTDNLGYVACYMIVETAGAQSVSISWTDANTCLVDGAIAVWEQASSGTTLTQSSTFTDTDTFHGGQLNRSLPQASTFTDSDTFHAASLRLTITQASTLTDSDTFHGGQLNLGLIQASTFTDADTFHGGDIIADQTLTQASTFDDADTFHGGTIVAAQALTQSSTFDDADSFHAASLNQSMTQASSLTDADTFNASALILSIIQSVTLADADTFYPATLTTASGVTLTQTDTFANESSFHGGALDGGSTPVAPGVDHITQRHREYKKHKRKLQEMAETVIAALPEPVAEQADEYKPFVMAHVRQAIQAMPAASLAVLQQDMQAAIAEAVHEWQQEMNRRATAVRRKREEETLLFLFAQG